MDIPGTFQSNDYNPAYTAGDMSPQPRMPGFVTSTATTNGVNPNRYSPVAPDGYDSLGYKAYPDNGVTPEPREYGQMPNENVSANGVYGRMGRMERDSDAVSEKKKRFHLMRKSTKGAEHM
jgi:hypothetical protein